MEIDDLLGCCVYDSVTKQHLNFTFTNSKEEYIRSNVENLILGCKNLNDLQPKVICTYNVKTGVITPCCEEFSFDVYKMPMTKADALAPLGADFSKEALEFAQWREERIIKLKEQEK